MINGIFISYGSVFKRSSEPVMKGSCVESIEEARNEYKNGEQVLYLKFDIIKN